MGYGAGDTTLISDNFTRGNESPIASPWVSGPGALDDVNLVNNKVSVAAVGGNGGMARYNVGASNAQWCRVTLATRAATTSMLGPVTRITSDTDCTAVICYTGYTLTLYVIASVDNGPSFNNISSAGTVAVNDIVELR